MLTTVLQEPIMVTGVGLSACSSQPIYPAPSAGGSVAALKGQIQQEQVQLNDWATCVSAKTTKGQAEIRKLSGEISAARQQINRVQQTQSAQQSHTATSTSRPGAVDVWA